MKKYLLGLFALACVSFQGHASDGANKLMIDAVKVAITSDVAINNVIDWRIGENQEYNLSAQFMGPVGTMKKWVESEEGNAIWVHSQTAGQVGNNLTKTLIDRATGKIKRIIQNGQEKKVPDDRPEIISQDETTITVPAGTFQAIHIVGKSKQIKKFEIWTNPRDTVMDGGLKIKIEGGFLPITLELTKFGK